MPFFLICLLHVTPEAGITPIGLAMMGPSRTPVGGMGGSLVVCDVERPKNSAYKNLQFIRPTVETASPDTTHAASNRRQNRFVTISMPCKCMHKDVSGRRLEEEAASTTRMKRDITTS